MNRQSIEIRSALAAEYVLGTLEGAARRRFERLRRDDAQLEREVARWERTLYRLASGVPAVKPPARVWRRIQAAIGPTEATRPAPPRAASAVTSLWGSLGFWRGWSFAATAAALVMAVALLVVPAATEVTYMVVVTDDARARASWVVSGHASSSQVRVRSLAPQAIPAGRVFQLWVLPAGASSVQSVGLIPADGDEHLEVTPAIAAILAGAQKFGVSVEPPGGSPTGQPTTTPLYHGTPMAL